MPIHLYRAGGKQYRCFMHAVPVFLHVEQPHWEATPGPGTCDSGVLAWRDKEANSIPAVNDFHHRVHTIEAAYKIPDFISSKFCSLLLCCPSKFRNLVSKSPQYIT